MSIPMVRLLFGENADIMFFMTKNSTITKFEKRNHNFTLHLVVFIFEREK